VLLINLAKYRKEKQALPETKPQPKKKPEMADAKKQPVCNA
jgi:hypothetical protein